MRDAAHSPRHPVREPAAVAQAIDYVRSLAARNVNPLAAIVGSRRAPPVFHQFPQPGINRVGEGLGYFYHSHDAPASPTREHGHFHLFGRARRRRGEDPVDSYVHLAGIGVDANGAPLRLFTTNLWVTAGRWRSAAFIRGELNRFAHRATRPDSGAERWIGLLLRLFPAEIRSVLRLRELKVAGWRREGVVQRRLADRRIHLLSAVPLALGEPAGSPRERAAS